MNEIEKEIKERSQKNEHLSKELEFTKSKLGKKKEKIKKFKEIILDCQNQLEKNKFDMIEIEEKNINLAEFIRKEIQNRPLDFDVSPPTFKQHGINYIQNSNNMNKSFENLRFSEFPIKDKVNNAKMFDSNSLIIEPKLKYKKYGEESHTQVNFHL